MSPSIRYETEALGVTSEGTTPGRHTSIEGFCLALSLGSPARLRPGLGRAIAYAFRGSRGAHYSSRHLRVLGDRASTREAEPVGGGRERAALCPGFGAEPHCRRRRQAGERVSPPAKDVYSPDYGQIRRPNPIRVSGVAHGVAKDVESPVWTQRRRCRG